MRPAPPAGAAPSDLSLRPERPSDRPLDRTVDTGSRLRLGGDAGRPGDAGGRLGDPTGRVSDTGRMRAAASDPLDLPLFEPSAPVPPSAGRMAPADDRPLISANLPPRPPLAVRRTTAEGARPRPRVTPQAGGGQPAGSPASARPTPDPRADEPRLDLDFTDVADVIPDEPDLSATGAPTITVARATEPAADTEVDADIAPLGSRLIAGALDLAFLLLVDAIVFYFTFRLTGVPAAEWRRLPLGPLVGFLALLHGGYLTMFTAASGQTMGKMVAKIKVVTIRGGAVPFGQAVLRAFVWLLTVPTVVGLIPALLSNDHRALHDRFADTRVIKAE